MTSVAIADSYSHCGLEKPEIREFWKASQRSRLKLVFKRTHAFQISATVKSTLPTHGLTLVVNSSSWIRHRKRQQLLLLVFVFHSSSGRHSQSPHLGVSSRAYHQRQVSLCTRTVSTTSGTDSPNGEHSWHVCPRVAEHPSLWLWTSSS